MSMPWRDQRPTPPSPQEENSHCAFCLMQSPLGVKQTALLLRIEVRVKLRVKVRMKQRIQAWLAHSVPIDGASDLQLPYNNFVNLCAPGDSFLGKAFSTFIPQSTTDGDMILELGWGVGWGVGWRAL